MERCVYEVLIAMDAKLNNFQITNALVMKCQQVYTQYMAELEKKGREDGNIKRIETKTHE